MADITLVPVSSEFDISRPCETNLSSKQYHFVLHDSAELVAIATANAKTLGILQNAPNGSSAQATAHVRVGGISKLKIAEGVAFGKFLTSTSIGKGEVCDAADEEYGAMSLGSGDTDDLIAVLVIRGEVTASDA